MMNGNDDVMLAVLAITLAFLVIFLVLTAP